MSFADPRKRVRVQLVRLGENAPRLSHFGGGACARAQIPDSSKLQLSFRLGPAVVFLTDFITVLLAKVTVFDEFVTSTPFLLFDEDASSDLDGEALQGVGGGASTARDDGDGDGEDEEGDDGDEDDGILHQFISGQAIVVQSGDRSTLFAAPLVTAVSFHLDGFSILCKNCARRVPTVAVDRREEYVRAPLAPQRQRQR